MGPRRPINRFCSLQVAIAGPAETLVRRGPLQDGAYTFAYSTKTPGTYTITATAAGGHMDGSPATVTASIAEAHAPLCEVIGTPLRVSTIAGQQQIACITLGNAYIHQLSSVVRTRGLRAHPHDGGLVPAP